MPDGFVRTGLKTYLIDQGVSTVTVGRMVALVSWPWALKWVWGPIIDRFQYSSMGRRRPWILSAQLGLTVVLLSMFFISNLTDSLWWLGVMILAANMFASLQDVSVDALAVDLLPEKERGIANGFMFASSYLGQFIGAAVIGGLLLSSGLRTAVGMQVLILLSIAAFPLLLRERREDAWLPGLSSAGGHQESAANGHSLRELFSRLVRAFSVRSSWLAALLALSSLVAINAHLVFWPVYLRRTLNWESSEYLRLEGNYAVWCGLTGSILGGVVASAMGAKRTVGATAALLSATWFAHAAFQEDWADKAVITSLFLIATFLAGVLSVSMFSMFMGIAWPPVAATQFTAYMAMLNLSSAIGANVAGTLEDNFDMTTIFYVLGFYQLVTIVLLLGIDPQETRRKLGDRN